MKTLGLIQARGGSKSVPKKNIRLLNNKPLIAYTIAAASKSKKLDRVILSTDSKEIADIALKYGAEVPFLRPNDLAKDLTPDKPVWQHAVRWMNENADYFPEAIAILRPTTPFKTSEIIDSAIDLFIKTGADSVRSVSRVNPSSHPYWMFTLGDDGKGDPFCKGISIEKYYQGQLLPEAYSLNGVVDVLRTDNLFQNKSLWGEDMRLHIVEEDYAVDIDTELDFLVCEALLKQKNGL